MQEFWRMIANLVRNFQPKFELGKKEALFGDQNTPGSSVLNTILILSRYFIWKHKFTSKTLDEVTFINFVKNHLQIIFQVQKLKKKETDFLINWRVWLDHFLVEID